MTLPKGAGHGRWPASTQRSSPSRPASPAARRPRARLGRGAFVHRGAVSRRIGGVGMGVSFSPRSDTVPPPQRRDRSSTGWESRVEVALDPLAQDMHLAAAQAQFACEPGGGLPFGNPPEDQDQLRGSLGSLGPDGPGQYRIEAVAVLAAIGRKGGRTLSGMPSWGATRRALDTSNFLAELVPPFGWR
jgi:hypothetical protein